jgi:hypothetical protein
MGAAMNKTTYSPGFCLAWAQYPHFQTRSYKKKAWERWKTLGLEGLTPNVLKWIEASRKSDDWQEGRVPGFQAWLSGPDFTEEPMSAGRQVRTQAERERLLKLWKASQRRSKEKKAGAKLLEFER